MPILASKRSIVSKVFISAGLVLTAGGKKSVIRRPAEKTDKRKDDSIFRKRNDESAANIVNTFTQALAKHGLKYDSVEKVTKASQRFF